MVSVLIHHILSIINSSFNNYNLNGKNLQDKFNLKGTLSDGTVGRKEC